MTTYAKSRRSSVTAILALFSLLLVAPFSIAGSDAIPKMSGIVSEMNHFPSDEQKETLSDISANEDYSEATRAIAQAIHDIEHQPTDEHVAALEEIASGSSATDAEKQLAEVVLAFNHSASAESKTTLESLMKD